jgi:hypothetical protein
MSDNIELQKKVLVSVPDKNGDGDILINLSRDEVDITLYDGYESRFITLDRPVAKKFFDTIIKEI